MTDADSTFPAKGADLPPIVRAEANAPIIPRRSWVWTIAPAYAGVFIAFPLLDRLGAVLLIERGVEAPVRSTCWWPIVLAVLGVILCDLLLYYPTAVWGWSSGRRLTLTSASAFGARGSEWLTGLGVALGSMVAYAVALHMALRLVFLGLISCGLLDANSLQPSRLGPIEIESSVFVLTAAFWIFITGTARLLGLPSVVFALMQVYTPVAFLLLMATALLNSGGLPIFLQPGDMAPTAGAAHHLTGYAGSAAFLDLLLGAFALSGLFAVEWGMVVQRRLDVRLGGWAGIVIAGSVAVVLALLTVAGASGKLGFSASGYSPGANVLTVPNTLHWAIFRGIGGKTGGAILLLFGLASLAPACYAIAVYSQRLSDHWPGLSLGWWTWLGSIPPFLLVATSLAGRLETIFGLMGVVFAPMVGVVSADAIRSRFRWGGIQGGWNLPGVLAWACGLTAGLMLRSRQEPATLLAYFLAAGIYLIANALLRQRPTVPIYSGESQVDLASSSTPDLASAPSRQP